MKNEGTESELKETIDSKDSLQSKVSTLEEELDTLSKEKEF